jgi:hypothetical protein
VVDDVGARHAEPRAIRATSASSSGRLAQRRCGEGEAIAFALQLHQADAALLHHVLAAGLAARFQPRMAAAQGRMAGERQLARRA